MIVLGLLFFFNSSIIRLASQICCFLKAKQADVALQIYSGVNIFSPFFFNMTWSSEGHNWPYFSTSPPLLTKRSLPIPLLFFFNAKSGNKPSYKTLITSVCSGNYFSWLSPSRRSIQSVLTCQITTVMPCSPISVQRLPLRLIMVYTV